jgi:hypothetical protein
LDKKRPLIYPGERIFDKLVVNSNPLGAAMPDKNKPEFTSFYLDYLNNKLTLSESYVAFAVEYAKGILPEADYKEGNRVHATDSDSGQQLLGTIVMMLPEESLAKVKWDGQPIPVLWSLDLLSHAQD